MADPGTPRLGIRPSQDTTATPHGRGGVLFLIMESMTALGRLFISGKTTLIFWTTGDDVSGCRRRAKTLRELSRFSSDFDERMNLLEMAEDWEGAADDLDMAPAQSVPK